MEEDKGAIYFSKKIIIVDPLVPGLSALRLATIKEKAEHLLSALEAKEQGIDLSKIPPTKEIDLPLPQFYPPINRKQRREKERKNKKNRR